MRARKEKLENFSEKFLRVVFYFQNWKLQLRADIVNIQSDIAEIKNKLTF